MLRLRFAPGVHRSLQKRIYQLGPECGSDQDFTSSQTVPSQGPFLSFWDPAWPRASGLPLSRAGGCGHSCARGELTCHARLGLHRPVRCSSSLFKCPGWEQAAEEDVMGRAALPGLRKAAPADLGPEPVPRSLQWG